MNRLWIQWFKLRCTGCQQKLLRKKIKDGSLGLPPPEPLVELGPDLHYFFLGDDAFALMPWMVKQYSLRKLTMEERIAINRISKGRRVVENAFGILVSNFRVLLGTREQIPRAVGDIVFTCVVFHSTLRTHQGQGRQGTNPRK